MEIWKEIEKWESQYLVSNQGRVKRKERAVLRTGFGIQVYPEKVLRPVDNGSGYKYIMVSINKNLVRDSIHRLVASAFLQRPPGADTVNHKDGDKANNTVENLEWLTQKENNQHSFRSGFYKGYDRTGSKNPNYRHGEDARISKQMNCVLCGALFTTKTIRSKFCSKSCACNYNMNNKFLKQDQLNSKYQTT